MLGVYVRPLRRHSEVMFFRFPVTNTLPKRNRVRLGALCLRFSSSRQGCQMQEPSRVIWLVVAVWGLGTILGLMICDLLWPPHK